MFGPENGCCTLTLLRKCKHFIIMVLMLHLIIMITMYINDKGSISKFSVVSSEKDLGVCITFKPDFTHCNVTKLLLKLCNPLG